MSTTVLVINPGSTSTKIAVFEDGVRLFDANVSHSTEEIAAFPSIASQYEFREKAIEDALAAQHFDTGRLNAVVGRGGLLKPIPGGVYRINEAMKADLLAAKYGEHASNLGALIADSFAKRLGIPAFIADPVVVDELQDVARVSGHRLFQRRSIFHALNQKAVARRFAKEKGLKYEDITVIVAHMGGGVSVGLHQGGRVVDVNQALNGEGPFSPERSGTLPAGDLVKLCFSGQYTQQEVLKMITGKGGFVSFLGTNDMRDVEKLRNEGNKEADLYYRAFIYQVGKYIGSLAAAAHGRVDGIILTGGIAYGKDVVAGIKEMVSFIAPVVVYPGEGELEALDLAGRMALSGEAEIQEYQP
ncbi:MAG: butyrate kinase [Spirochaetaceae bacterium]|nr:butyrate kinase [Spirochaetaceae bacterium]